MCVGVGDRSDRLVCGRRGVCVCVGVGECVWICWSVQRVWMY